MVYELSNGHMTTKVLWGSTVGYPSDSLTSCYKLRLQHGRPNQRAPAWNYFGLLFYDAKHRYELTSSAQDLVAAQFQI